MRQATPPDKVYLTGPQVDKRYNINPTTRLRWTKDPKIRFPKPDLEINGRYFWSEKPTLETWEAAFVPRGKSKRIANVRKGKNL